MEFGIFQEIFKFKRLQHSEEYSGMWGSRLQCQDCVSPPARRRTNSKVSKMDWCSSHRPTYLGFNLLFGMWIRDDRTHAHGRCQNHDDLHLRSSLFSFFFFFFCVSAKRKERSLEDRRDIFLELIQIIIDRKCGNVWKGLRRNTMRR